MKHINLVGISLMSIAFSLTACNNEEEVNSNNKSAEKAVPGGAVVFMSQHNNSNKKLYYGSGSGGTRPVYWSSNDQIALLSVGTSENKPTTLGIYQGQTLTGKVAEVDLNLNSGDQATWNFQPQTTQVFYGYYPGEKVGADPSTNAIALTNHLAVGAAQTGEAIFDVPANQTATASIRPAAAADAKNPLQYAVAKTQVGLLTPKVTMPFHDIMNVLRLNINNTAAWEIKKIIVKAADDKDIAGKFSIAPTASGFADFAIQTGASKEIVVAPNNYAKTQNYDIFMFPQAYSSSDSKGYEITIDFLNNRGNPRSITKKTSAVQQSEVKNLTFNMPDLYDVAYYDSYSPMILMALGEKNSERWGWWIYPATGYETGADEPMSHIFVRSDGNFGANGVRQIYGRQGSKNYSAFKEAQGTLLFYDPDGGLFSSDATDVRKRLDLSNTQVRTPDIVLVGEHFDWGQLTDPNSMASLLTKYADAGGVVIVLQKSFLILGQGFEAHAKFFDDKVNNIRDLLEDHLLHRFITSSSDPIITGKVGSQTVAPFGNVSGRYWGEDRGDTGLTLDVTNSSGITVLSNTRNYNDAAANSTKNPITPGGLQYVSMLYYETAKKSVFWCGDGMFLGSRWFDSNHSPFCAYDGTSAGSFVDVSNKYVGMPMDRLNYGDSRAYDGPQQTVCNSKLFGNVLNWAIKRAKTVGIHAQEWVGTGD